MATSNDLPRRCSLSAVNINQTVALHQSGKTCFAAWQSWWRARTENGADQRICVPVWWPLLLTLSERNYVRSSQEDDLSSSSIVETDPPTRQERYYWHCHPFGMRCKDSCFFSRVKETMNDIFEETLSCRRSRSYRASSFIQPKALKSIRNHLQSQGSDNILTF